MNYPLIRRLPLHFSFSIILVGGLAAQECRREIFPPQGSEAFQRFGSATAPGDFGVAIRRSGQGGPGVDIYVRNSGTGEHLYSATLTPPPGVLNSNYYGLRLDYQNGTLAVSSRTEGVDQGGAVHVYNWNGHSFDFATTLTPSESVQDGQFGKEISISGQRLAVYSQRNHGTLFLYERNTAGQWIESHIVESPLSYLAGLVKLEGDYMAVATSSSSPWRGGLVYRYSPLFDDWIVEGNFYRSYDGGFDLNDQVLVSGKSNSGGTSHFLYTYQRDNLGAWIYDPATILTVSIAAKEIALNGARLAVRSHYELAPSPDSEPASIDLFERNTDGSWSNAGRVTDSERYADAWPLGSTRYGASLKWFEDLIFVGASRDGPMQYGRVYTYDTTCTLIDEWACFQEDPNSTGKTGTLYATGSVNLSDPELILTAYQLPLDQFGYFIASEVSSSVPIPVGSSGGLCMPGPIGRFNGLDQIQYSGSSGSVTFEPDLQGFPTPAGLLTVQAGQTWHFQFWHRDSHSFSFTDTIGVSY